MRHPTAVQLTGLLGTLLAVPALAVVGATFAGYTDRTAAVIETGGTYDIEVSGTAQSTGTLEQSEGNPDPLVLATTGSTVYTKTAPVVWTVTVHNTGVAGDVALTLADPEDVPVAAGYADLFTQLRFTLTDRTSETVLATAKSAVDVNAAHLVLEDMAAGATRTVEISAVLDADTWRIYDGRTTSVAVVFDGVNS
ncbi:hypothetical protein [Cellulomonas hominis]